MRTRLVALSVVLLAGLFCASNLLAQTAPQAGASNKPVPRAANGKPDLAGLWRVNPLRSNILQPPGANAAGGNAAGGGGLGGDPTGRDPYRVPAFGFLPVGTDGRPQEPPLQPWALEKYRAIRKGALTLVHRGPEEHDPAMRCIPEGFPRAYTYPDPFEILHPLPDRIVMIFPTMNQARQIYTDGRKHTDVGPMFMGHAIGHWDGDNLVTDTIALKGDPLVWLDTHGTPHSDQLHVIERIKRPTYDTLEIDFTFEDPGAFTRPWEGKKRFFLMPADWEQMEYMVCDTPKALGGDDQYSF